MGKKETGALSGAATGAAAGSALGPWGAVAGGVIGGLGGLFGANEAEAEQEAANKARAAALAQYANISIPEAEDMMINLQQYQSQGTLDPMMENLIQQDNTSMEGISLDPRLRQEQMSALEQYSNLAKGGVNEADQAAFELARQNAAGEQQARQNAILQDMQQRGQAGSGAELLAKLTSNQSGAQMLQKAQLEQAQAMQQARMAALSQQANLGSSIRGQDYGEQADLAKARDAIANFNAQNAQSVQSRNVGAKNTAQAGNLANLQQLANMNTETMNKQQIHNKGLGQQTFQNQMDLASAKAGQYGQQASAAQNQAANTAGMWGSTMQGVGTALSGLANQFSAKPAKPTVKMPNSVGGKSTMIPFDPNDFDSN